MQNFLAIIGMPLNPQDPLPSQAHNYINDAQLIMGAARHLKRIENNAAKQKWQTPFAHNISLILDHHKKGKNIALLASGDPSFYGIASSLAHHELCPIVIPAVSSLSLAAARMRWRMEDTECVSLHGRDLSSILPHLAPRKRLLILGEDEQTPQKLGTLLTHHGYGASSLSILARLDTTDEHITHHQAYDSIPLTHPLHVMALICQAQQEVYAPHIGLHNDAFDSSMISQEEGRWLALLALRPFAGGLLWDVGAGGGSITIEWLRAHKNNRALAIEQNKERCALIAHHADQFGVASRLTLLCQKAPDALHNLDTPDAIFIGGGTANPSIHETCLAKLKTNGCLVAHAITEAGQKELTLRQKNTGGLLRRLDISNQQGQNFVTKRTLWQWIFIK